MGISGFRVPLGEYTGKIHMKPAHQEKKSAVAGRAQAARAFNTARGFSETTFSRALAGPMG